MRRLQHTAAPAEALAPVRDGYKALLLVSGKDLSVESDARRLRWMSDAAFGVASVRDPRAAHKIRLAIACVLAAYGVNPPRSPETVVF